MTEAEIHKQNSARLMALPGPAAAGQPTASTRPRAALEGEVPRKSPIRVLLADDHPVVRKGISACLARYEHLQIVGEAADGAEALRKTRELRPDLVLMDVDMPRMSGLAVTESLRKELPQVKVLILSMFRNPDYVVRIIQSGARGYVLKEAPTDELVKAIEMVTGGQTFFSPEVASAALNQFVRGSAAGDPGSTLSNREREVLALVAEGLSNKEIATRLGVGVRTVETHRERIMRRLDIHTIAGLTRFAIAKGLVAFPRSEPATATRPGPGRADTGI